MSSLHFSIYFSPFFVFLFLRAILHVCFRVQQSLYKCLPKCPTTLQFAFGRWCAVFVCLFVSTLCRCIFCSSCLCVYVECARYAVATNETEATHEDTTFMFFLKDLTSVQFAFRGWGTPLLEHDKTHTSLYIPFSICLLSSHQHDKASDISLHLSTVLI